MPGRQILLALAHPAVLRDKIPSQIVDSLNCSGLVACYEADLINHPQGPGILAGLHTIT